MINVFCSGEGGKGRVNHFLKKYSSSWECRGNGEKTLPLPVSKCRSPHPHTHLSPAPLCPPGGSAQLLPRKALVLGGTLMTEEPGSSRSPTLSGLLPQKVAGSIGRKQVALEGVRGSPSPGVGAIGGPLCCLDHTPGL